MITNQRIFKLRVIIAEINVSLFNNFTNFNNFNDIRLTHCVYVIKLIDIFFDSKCFYDHKSKNFQITCYN